MNGHEIRRKFLEYFQERGHKTVHSSPVFPPNDPTILFTNAGMNQFKDVFLGNEKRDYTRAASSQKCIRAGGKHNDLDEVGKTARHHTFFEMLGNFSFGDYFKKEAIEYAWDFLVNELKLDPERLWFTVFAGDDEVQADEEAVRLWIEAGARPERVLRFGRKDNFWQMAETGPCGPNSEINYYLGDDPTNPEKNRADLVNADEGDETMEIWNLVFMQYNRVEIEKGIYKLEPLPAPSVDTGAGLERMTVVMEGVHSNYETSLIKPIIEFISELSGKKYEYESQEGFAMRVVADHARATTFAVADGIVPGNEGRSYVLRKIMRRAIYHGRKTLGFNNLFFHKVCEFVVEQMREAFPELEAQREFIDKMVGLEEERFGSTMTVGLEKLEQIFSASQTADFSQLAKLYDTFGTPKDLIRVSMEERGIEIGEDEFDANFDKALKELQQTSEIGKTNRKEQINPIYASVLEKTGAAKFHGYDETRIEDAKVVAIFDGEKQIDELNEGAEGSIVLDNTPFYAESGGQVGDTGTIVSAEATANVFDTYAPVSGLIIHKAKIERGSLRVGDEVTAQVDSEKRDATRRNHTATHLVHAALREVLGTHVKQAGSVVAPNFLRFDFTHYQPLTAAEVKEIEDLVNHYILQNEPVATDVMAIEEAMRSGAMALFGEKYGSDVRVLRIGEGTFSKELCGGTHVRATGDIGSFKITSDESIASGVR
ncbi:MAG TPA: alanine--tRNA ligase, partial [Pyrinomonadaceae bacterium]|nr:alanine--tRNA ligase [Pyrinomonadaceae bacterium]